MEYEEIPTMFEVAQQFLKLLLCRTKQEHVVSNSLNLFLSFCSSVSIAFSYLFAQFFQALLLTFGSIFSSISLLIYTSSVETSSFTSGFFLLLLLHVFSLARDGLRRSRSI